MKSKNFKSIKVDSETFQELEEFCQITGATKSNFIRGMIKFFKSNQPLITADFFQKSETKKKETFYSASENFQKEIEKVTGKLMKKETNRVIAFLKVQDKFLSTMKEDLYSKLDKDNLGEYHPLFQYMDFLLQEIEKYLQANNENFYTVYSFLRENEGEEKANFFSRSLKNVQEKTLKY